jgi:signal peptidase II
MLTPPPAARWFVVAGILLSCVGCDQAAKHIAQARLKGHPPRSFCGDLMRLQYAENPGAFLGLGGQMPPLARWAALVGVNGLIAAALVGFLLLGGKIPPLRLAACTLLLSGAVGNLIDRLRFDGLVVDFLNLGIGPLRTGIFNVADLAIVAGAVLSIVPMLAAGDRPPNGPRQA